MFHDFVNKFLEREAYIDPVWREWSQLKNEFLFAIFRLSVLRWCKHSLQIGYSVVQRI